ncbi:glutamate decarboxylase 2 [Grus japonensis]|uniref:glutamate decarboxylase n=1 Tax=Grus japonensis TaxID=30415 RepID=A0ABC9WH52_GRUJA
MASPGSGFWPFGAEEGSAAAESPGTARAWCQVAQKFTGGIGNKLCDLLPACNGEITTMSFLQDVVDILLQYVVKSFDRSTKVIDFHYPNELLQEYNWELADQPQTLEEILLNCRTTLKYAIKTGHPRYFNQLSTGLDMVGLAADWLTSAANTNIGKMIPSDLERRILEAKQKGFVPFLVSATAGTTVYGAFDPLIAIADICKKYKIWMHVDFKAITPCPVTTLPDKQSLSSFHVGPFRANSVTWNPHKMMGVPLQCSALLVREEGLMQSCNQMHASYLFQQDKHYDLSYDTGDKALQCGRHVDVFKLWLMWRAKGTTGFEAQIDKCLELAEYLYNKIKNREGYEMVFDGKVAPVIKARMMEYGTTMVSYQPLGDKVNFFRMVISNPAATHQDIDFLIDEIERLGQDL